MQEFDCFTLEWENHWLNYRKTLNTLREEKVHTDVILACEDQIFDAHKLVLVTCSDYFKEILAGLNCQQPAIYLRGVKASEIKAMIDFMYTGIANVSEDEMSSLLHTAHSLRIKGLGIPFNVDDTVSKMTYSAHSNENKKILDKANVLQCKKICVKKILSEKKAANDCEIISPPDKRFKSASNCEIISPSDKQFKGKNNGLIHGKETNQNPHLSGKNDFTELCSNSPVNNSDLSLPRPISYSECSKDYSRSDYSVDIKTTGYPLNEASTSACAYNEIQSPMSDQFNSFKNTKEETVPEFKSLDHFFEVSNEKLDSPTKNHLVKNECKDHLEKKIVNPSNVEEDAKMFFDAFNRNAPLPFNENNENLAKSIVDPERPFSCPVCQKSFAKPATLKRHHLAHFRPYVCDLCCRAFTRREILAEHVMEHSGVDLRLPCPVCPMIIKRKRNLQAHIKTKHPLYWQEHLANNNKTTK